MANLFTVTYGTRAFTGILIAPPQEDKTYTDAMVVTFALQVLIEKDTIANLNTELLAIEADLTKQDQTLTVARGGSNVLSVTPSTNAGGYLTRASLRNNGNPQTNLEITRKLDITFSYIMPMLQTDSDAWGNQYKPRKNLSVRVSYRPSRLREVNIVCTYCATPGTPAKSAIENWTSDHATFCAAILAKASGVGSLADRLGNNGTTFELLSEEPQFNDRSDKEVTVATRFFEVPFAQTAADTNDLRVSDVHITFTKRPAHIMGVGSYGGPGGASRYAAAAVRQPIVVECTWTGEVSTNSADTANAIWIGAVRAHLLSKLYEVFGLQSDQYTQVVGPVVPQQTPSHRILSANMTVALYGKANNLSWVSYDETVSFQSNGQKVYIKPLSGKNDDYSFYTSGRKLTASVDITAVTIGAEAPMPPRWTGDWSNDSEQKRSTAHAVDDNETGAGSFVNHQLRKKQFTMHYSASYTLATGGVESAQRVERQGRIITGASKAFK